MNTLKTRINGQQILHFCSGREMDNVIKCRGEMLTPLSQMSKVVIESESLTDRLSLLLKIMEEDMGVVRGMVNLFNSQTGKIFIHDSIGLTEKEETRGVYSLGEGITGKVVETGEAVVIPRICDEPAFLNRTKSLITSADAELSFVCIPIKSGRKVLGAISVERICNNPDLLRYDVEILEIIATMIAQAVEIYLIENEESNSLRLENKRLKDALKEKFHPSNIIGNSKAMFSVYELINKIARTKSTVLLLGESGVGKELVASAIHYNSPEAAAPFIKFNCAALPESIIESELFGHEKGSFTGADKARKGRFEDADGGTIFVDEIGELSLQMQAKLLRVLQERSFERVGGNETIQVDIRIIAATNRDLFKMVKEGTFREDLYYRLNVFPIIIPPLCERNSDIIILAKHFMNLYVKKFNKDLKKITIPVQEMLLNYSWPGNVRELENVIERAVILSDDNFIHGYDLPLSIQTPTSSNKTLKKGLVAKLEIVEYEMIVEALENHKGNMSAAADELGLTRRILGLRLEKFGVDYRKYKEL